MPVALICRFRHAHSGGTVADLHSLPFSFPSNEGKPKAYKFQTPLLWNLPQFTRIKYYFIQLPAQCLFKALFLYSLGFKAVILRPAK